MLFAPGVVSRELASCSPKKCVFHMLRRELCSVFKAIGATGVLTARPTPQPSDGAEMRLRVAELVPLGKRFHFTRLAYHGNKRAARYLCTSGLLVWHVDRVENLRPHAPTCRARGHLSSRVLKTHNYFSKAQLAPPVVDVPFDQSWRYLVSDRVTTFYPRYFAQTFIRPADSLC
jgi:hypothetical protein